MALIGKNKGIANFQNKLSEQDVLEIYHDSCTTQASLAKKYKVSQSTINHIKSGRIWRWLTKHEKSINSIKPSE